MTSTLVSSHSRCSQTSLDGTLIWQVRASELSTINSEVQLEEPPAEVPLYIRKYVQKDVLEATRSRGDPGSFTGDQTSDLWITTDPLLVAYVSGSTLLYRCRSRNRSVT
ncbi:hypothetical protein DPMN_104534 [Dreissena polymorpha]|uniref:Uncharacterized protein n=1 Tax=Dreissena polymorpha TaxID=45954 RepID=A0A9D4HFT7_DREPO|nr:hypothetical protein DPMN_104534 [Dreissena polymorpha]